MTYIASATEVRPRDECWTLPDATSVGSVALGIAGTPHADHVAVIEAGAKQRADGSNVRPS